MKKILKNRKALMSAGAIVLALTMMIGATYAWWTVSGDQTALIEVGVLGVRARFFPDVNYNYGNDPTFNYTNEAFQPGDYLTRRGYIKNTGTVTAFIEINQSPNTYLPKALKTITDPNHPTEVVYDPSPYNFPNDYQATPIPANENGVLFYINVPLFAADGVTPINENYISDGTFDNFENIIDGNLPYVFHFTTVDAQGKRRYFLEMAPGAELIVDAILDLQTNARLNRHVRAQVIDKLGAGYTEELAQETIWDEIRNADGYEVLTDDFISNWVDKIWTTDNDAKYLDNKYFKAYVTGVGDFVATQGLYPLAIRDLFDVDYRNLDWAQSGVPAFGANYKTPADVIDWLRTNEWHSN